MRRTVLHICFWLAYLCQDTLLSYLWSAARLHDLPVANRAMLALLFCASLLPPKIIFTCFVVYGILPGIVQRKAFSLYYGCLLTCSLIITLASFRCIEVYWVYPLTGGHFGATRANFQAFSLLFNFIDLGFICGLAIAIKQVKMQLRNLEREQSLVKEKLEAELKFLRNQTHPHFLFNTLNNIYGLARRRSEDTAAVVMKLSKLLRFLLYETGRPLITIDEELKLLEDYIDLQKIRYSNQLSLHFEKQIDQAGEPIAPLLLLPLVENAFKHGASETRFACFIHLLVKLKNGVLYFEIENSKEDIDTIPPSDGIGLANVKRQLELMYREHYLKISDKSTTFQVLLEINLRSHEQIPLSYR